MIMQVNKYVNPSVPENSNKVCFSISKDAQQLFLMETAFQESAVKSSNYISGLG